MLGPVTPTTPISSDPGVTSRSSGPNTLVVGIAANDAVDPTAPFTAICCAMPPSVEPRTSMITAPGVYSSRPSFVAVDNIAPVEMYTATDATS